MIETLDDIIEWLADQIGVYGAHDDECEKPDKCRLCWTSDLKERIDSRSSAASSMDARFDGRTANS